MFGAIFRTETGDCGLAFPTPKALRVSLDTLPREIHVLEDWSSLVGSTTASLGIRCKAACAIVRPS